MQRLHEPEDEAKIKRLQKSMEENGWLGVALVEDNGLLLTGMHRSEAWERAELSWEDPPTIDIRDLIPNYEARLTELTEHLDWYDALSDIVDDHPDICTEYGIELR